jgi:hypothetical protein
MHVRVDQPRQDETFVGIYAATGSGQFLSLGKTGDDARVANANGSPE